MSGHRLRRFGVAAVVVITLALPSLLERSALSFYVLLSFTAIVTVGLSLLMGHAGQVSLGQGAFYAIGAYAAGILAVRGCPGLGALVVAPFVAAAFAVVVGIPLLLLRGHHLAFATLATHLILLSMIGEMTSVTGGDIGLQGIPRLRIGPFDFGTDRDCAYLGWTALWAVVLVARNVMASRPGRALRALATSEVAAEACGIPVGRYKLAVFALSAGFAGLAGGLYSFYVGYIAPGSFPLLLSIQYVVMSTIGGAGTISGALAGTAAVMLLVQLLARLGTMNGMPAYAPAVLSYAAYAVLLIAAVLFLPDGLVPAVAALRKRLGNRD